MTKKRGKRIAVCDAETDPFKRGRVPLPFVWGFYDGETYEEFSSTEEFSLYLMGFDGICYAHNGGRFDWHFLLPYASAYDELMLINGRIAKMKIGDCECRDSLNIIPVGLGKMEKEEIDYSIFEESERNKPLNKIAISKYLKSDCVNLYKFVSRFIEDYGMQLTQAGAAMKQWAKISDAPIPKTTPEFYNYFAPYYYGGRVECFRSGIVETDFSVLDINSAYPYAMLHSHPYSDNYLIRPGYSKNADFVRVRCVSRGALPFRGLGIGNGQHAGLRFPSDDELREYTVTNWEYQAGMDTGTLENVEVLESIVFMTHTDFSEYIDYFWQLRQKCIAGGDAAGSLFCKLLMNSLYGKFAANPDNYKNYMIVPQDVVSGLDAHGWQFAGDFGPWALAQSDLAIERQRYYNVATGASITGFVRAMLWRAICNSKGVLYCDTDSIAVEKAGENVLLGSALGEWKNEGSFDKAGIAGKKLYIFRSVADSSGKRFFKSASKGAKLTDAQLWKVAKGGEVVYKQEAPTFSPKKLPSFVERKIRKTA